MFPVFTGMINPQVSGTRCFTLAKGCHMKTDINACII